MMRPWPVAALLVSWLVSVRVGKRERTASPRPHDERGRRLRRQKKDPSRGSSGQEVRPSFAVVRES
jgi:hypothetical protein